VSTPVGPGPAPDGPARAEASEISAVPELAMVTPVVFRAGCPDCRARFELPAAALRLAIGGSASTTFYSFTCPECGTAVRKPAGERIVELLTGGGVRTLRLHTTV
jgi:RNase P subunit RPR2